MSNPRVQPKLREVRHRIQAGETVSQVLASAGLGAPQVSEWLEATRRVYDLNRVHVGQELSLSVDRESKELHHLTLEIDPGSVLVAERTDSRVVARRERIRCDRHFRVGSGKIKSSLHADAVLAGIPAAVVVEMGRVLALQFDPATELRPGAYFRVVYEELTRAGTMKSNPGRVLALKLINRGRSYEAYYFTMPDGRYRGYYNRRGHALGTAFLRYPLAVPRITSPFSSARYHPVLKKRIPHYGVDFAAARGTPIKAVADGRVLKAGWYGGLGRFVRLRHDSIYQTGYAHLSRFARGIKAGATVRKGQVIGYAGSTGLATGPHLHFVMYRNGKYIDPLKADLPRARALSGRELAQFRTTVGEIDRVNAQARRSGTGLTQVAAVSLAE
jgi:murein DD-endopeptidase MepM/ murein hydrolase activator NlpD